MNKQYAVFDWDNTVRDGFTLFDWIDYLVNRGVLTEEIQVAIDTRLDCFHMMNMRILHVRPMQKE